MKKMRHLVLLITILTSFPAFSEDNESAAEAAAGEVVQEIKYVTDKLRLSLYHNADSKSGTIKLLLSGDKLEILQRQGNYSKVRTNQGLTGWVKNGFLVSDPTATLQLAEEKKKNKILAQQIEKYADTKKVVDDYEKTIGLMKTDFDQKTEELNETKTQLEQYKQQSEQLAEELQLVQEGKIGLNDLLLLIKEYWYLLFLGVVVLLLVGFFIGKILVEEQVKSRFQGVKVW